MNGGDVDRIVQQLDKLSESQAELKVDFAGLKGVVVTTLEQHAANIDVLFGHRNKHEKRIAGIERTYVTDEEHDRAVDKNAKAHKEFRDGLDEQRSFSGKLVGGAIVVGIVGSALLAWMLKG